MLTKKEKQLLDSNKAIIENTDSDNGYHLFMSLTGGQVLTMQNALKAYEEAGSHIGGDLRAFLDNAIERSGLII